MVIKSPEKNPVDPAVNPNEEMEVKREPQSPTYSPPPDADALQITGQKRARSPLSDGSQGREKNRKKSKKEKRKRKRHDSDSSSSGKSGDENRRKNRKKKTRRSERESSETRATGGGGSPDLNRDDRGPTPNLQDEDAETLQWMAKKRNQKEEVDPLKTKAGGAYIPPAKLRMMQQQIADKGSERYQRLEWERLKKRIHGHVNKINVGNLVGVVRDLLQENIVRGKGLLARSIIQAQAFSPSFSHVYAGLVSVINSKFPHIGELVLRRLIVQFKRSFKRNDKQTTITVTKFLAHLINQQVAHEVLALEILTLLLETPTDDSVEVAVAFLKECGAKMTEVTPRGINAIFDRLRSILQESKDVDKRVQYMIEVIFSVRKDKFSAHPAVTEELDLVEEDDQITHTVTLDDAQDPENILNVFRMDPDFEQAEEMYEEIKKEILGDDSDEDEEEEDSEGSDEEGNDKKLAIIDNTETNLVAFRRLVYLTIQSSLDYQEAAHKLMKLEIKPGMESELCNMILDCCAQQRTYEKFYGLLAERFCRIRREYQQNMESIFKDTYETIHRFEITKLRNTTKLFAHLLFTDAISWEVLSVIKLNEDDSTSSGRIFVKILFQELSEYLGLDKLFARIRDGTLQTAFEGLFPRDNPRDTRFSINFFTSIGLGGLTEDLREHLQSGPKQIVNLPEMPSLAGIKAEGSSDSSDSDSDSSSSSSEESEDERSKKEIKRERTDDRSSRREDYRRNEEAPSFRNRRHQGTERELEKGDSRYDRPFIDTVQGPRGEPLPDQETLFRNRRQDSWRNEREERDGRNYREEDRREKYRRDDNGRQREADRYGNRRDRDEYRRR